MKTRAVWVCPVCAKKLAEPVIHTCPHGRVCIPGLAGEHPSAAWDECDKCATNGVLWLDYCGPARVLPDGQTVSTAESSEWARRRAQEAECARAQEAGARAQPDPEERRARAKKALEQARVKARELAIIEGPRALAALREGRKVRRSA